MKIWDNFNKQYLEVMTIHFGDENEIVQITACVPGADPLRDGWYKLIGEDLNKISINEIVSLNPELMPVTEVPKKTSIDWAKEAPFVVLDPDGWDRQNFTHSFYVEKITEEEFLNRASHSTCISKFGN